MIDGSPAYKDLMKAFEDGSVRIRDKMDEETKRIFDSILSESIKWRRSKDFGRSDKLAWPTAAEASFGVEAKRRAEAARLEEAERRRKAEAEPKPTAYKPVDAAFLRKYRDEPRRFYDRMPLASDQDTREAVAVVCVNTAKGCIVLRGPISGTLAGELHRVTQSKDISYNNVDEVLEFHPRWLPDIKLVLNANFASVTVLAAQKAVKPTKFDLLIAKLNKNDKQSIYNMLAKRYHPDLPHGDKEIMTLVNLVFKGGD